MQKHLSNKREDYINSCFKCVGVLAYSREVIKGFGSCSYYPDCVVVVMLVEDLTPLISHLLVKVRVILAQKEILLPDALCCV